MGIRENFTQALRELTGSGKDNEADKKNLPIEEMVDELEKTVDAYDPYGTRGIRPKIDGKPADAPIEKSEKPIYKPVEAERPIDRPVGIPASEASLPGKDASSPLFAQMPDQSASVAPVIEKPVAEPYIPQPNVGVSEGAAPVIEKPVAAPLPTQPGAGNAGTANAGGGQNFAAAAVFAGFRQRSDADEANELTVISRNTFINGSIRSFADMNIEGDIRGDVETTKNIELNGKIVGNINCNNAFMHRAQVQGNLRVKGSLSMKRDTLLIGDLMSTYAEVNGKIKGNVGVAGKAEVKGDAVVFGDISASAITVEDGAVIEGHVSTTSLNKDESRNIFPEAIVIVDRN